MPTIVNNPNGSDSGSGYVVGIIVAIILLILFFIFGLPALRGDSMNTTNTNVPTQTQPRVQQPNNTTNNYNSTTTINVGATTTGDN